MNELANDINNNIKISIYSISVLTNNYKSINFLNSASKYVAYLIFLRRIHSYILIGLFKNRYLNSRIFD